MPMEIKVSLWLVHWFTNPWVLTSKSLGASIIDALFYPSSVDQISTQNSLGLGVYTMQ